MNGVRVLRSGFRALLSLMLFGLFGLGALAVSPLMLLLRRPDRGQPVVRVLWHLLLELFKVTGLLEVVHEDLSRIRGSVIVANHPSLIDVVVLTVLVPRTLYVAKSGLLKNPFIAAIVRATSLPDDGHLPDVAASYLAKGWNVLIFPEGTRSPLRGGLNPFRRGAAQLALRTGAPIVCLALTMRPRILAKAQPVWKMSDRRVRFSIVQRFKGRVTCEPNETRHHAASRITDCLYDQLHALTETSLARLRF